MTKDEYVKKLQKYYEDNKLKNADSYGEGYTDGLAEALDYVIDLAEKLDEPEKVVIPEFIANDIDRRKKKGSTLRIFLEDIFDWRTKSDVYYWFFADGGDENFMKYISAWSNGYEVEKEKKYLVKIDSKLYFQRFENIEAVFVIDDSLGVKESSPVFTREVGNKILEILGVESGQLEEVEDE